MPAASALKTSPENPKRKRGRPKGSPNKASIYRQAAIEAGGLTPLAYMLMVMRDETVPTARRDEMAKASAPYSHPRLAATEFTGAAGGPVQVVQVNVDAAELGKHKDMLKRLLG